MPKLFLGNSLRKTVDRVPGLQQLLWGIEAVLIAIPVGISALLPPGWASAAGRRLFRALGPRLDKTRIIRWNLKIAFPEKPDSEITALVRDIWGNIGAVLAEYPHLQAIARAASPQHLEVVIDDDCRVFREHGKPAVFVAAHMSNWEVPPLAAAQQGLPLSVVYTPMQNPWLDRLLYRAREKMGCRLISRDGGMRTLMRELSRGKPIGLLVDQRVKSGESVPFFGIERPTTVAPARLALRYDCELIPVRVQRIGCTRYRVSFHAPVSPPENTTDEQQKVLAMTREINRLFENWITEQTGEWLCSKRRWPKGTQPVQRTRTGG